MDVTKAPTTTDPASLGVGSAANSASTSSSRAAAGVSTASTAVTAPADRVDIQPLDVAAALQILIAEVRAELPLPGATSPAGMALGIELPEAEPRPDGSALWPQTSPGIAPPGTDTDSGAITGPNLAPLPAGELPSVGLPVMPPGARLSSPAQTAPMLMRLFIQAVPEDAGTPAKWSATVTQLEVTLQAALDRAVATVEQWRNVSQVVVDAVRETRSLVMSQLSDEPPLPLWLRPEWVWLSPQMERFRRRRRLARRGLTDPDWWSPREDDLRQESPGKRRDEP